MTVRCKRCLETLQALERGDIQVDEARLEVGNRASDDFGHAMFFCDDGITAACVFPVRRRKMASA